MSYEDTPSYQLGRLQGAVEAVIVDLINGDKSHLDLARRLVVALGGPANLSPDGTLDWVSERRDG